MEEILKKISGLKNEVQVKDTTAVRVTPIARRCWQKSQHLVH